MRPIPIRPLLRSMLVAGLLASSACAGTVGGGSSLQDGSSSIDAEAATDAGLPGDATPEADAGSPQADAGSPQADAGELLDSGNPPADAGEPRDAGNPPADAGNPPADAGNPPTDAGQPRDAGNPPDAGQPHDAGNPPADAGQPRDGGSPNPVRSAANIYFVGHSLVNHVMPEMLQDIARGFGMTHNYDCQIKNGTNLKVQWEEAAPGEGRAGDGQDGHPNSGQRLPGDAHTALPTGSFDVVVLAELVPPINHIRWSCSAVYALDFYNLAVQANPNTQVYYYEVWGHRSDAAWRSDIDMYRSIVNEYIVDAVNTPHVPLRIPPGQGRCSLDQSLQPSTRAPGPEMLVIPGGRAIAMLSDAISAGTVPGVTQLGALFTDDLHLNELGNYFMAMVFYGTIYGRNPAGAVTHTDGEWAHVFATVDAATAARFAEIAWAAVLAEPRSGVH